MSLYILYYVLVVITEADMDIELKSLKVYVIIVLIHPY